MTDVMICKSKKKCGGCQYQGVAYEDQLIKKQEAVKKLLCRYGKVSPILGAENPFYYRNKVHAVFARDKKGNVISGTYEEKSHRVVPVEKCLIEDQKSQEIISTVRKLLPSFKVKIYDEDTRLGLLRHVLVRRGFETGEIMVVLVIADPIFPSKHNFVKALRREHPEITTVVLNVNDKKTSMVLGSRDIVIYGPGFIKDRLCGCTFRISPQSFYQVNPAQTEILYKKAMELAGLSGKETVLDAYCGIGTIGLAAAKQAKRVMGVELNKDAVRDAQINRRENRGENTKFVQGDAGDFMARMAETGEKVDVVFMDPPRAGSDEKFLSSMVKLAPERVVYISCNPETQARDLKYLTGRGYRVKVIQPVDMFPFTEHVETVVLLSQLKPDDTIEIDLDLDELDATSAETKATYEEIKEYVKEKYQLKVSNLYISQIKRKCGIEVGINYNLPKSENSRVPQCPPEKEKAIREALEYFQMIS